MNTPILLSTLNARYQHSSFGLRYILANMGDLRSQTTLQEFTINQDPRFIAEEIAARAPRILGMSVYIWNTVQTEQVIGILKKIAPEICVVLGGPEISYETEGQNLATLANYIVRGEGDLAFPELCRQILECANPSASTPTLKIIDTGVPEISKIKLPYDEYTNEDIAHRVIYVEASRGCPYRCEYCLSSLDKSVRSFDLTSFLTALDQLIERGARQFKFVDRTFNLSISTSVRILEYFLEKQRALTPIHSDAEKTAALFLHFEMVPDRLPSELQDLLTKFPPGSLQFEIGIQTLNQQTSELVSRRQNLEKTKSNFEFLTTKTSVHIHADLIVGLPGETVESFGAGFDTLLTYQPHEIQVGVLKRLKGTPLSRHDQTWQMKYQDFPPFQVLQTKTMSYFEIQELSRFAHFWDLIANRGQLPQTNLLFQRIFLENYKSVFCGFLDLTRFLHNRHPQGHSIALLSLLESLWIYLTENHNEESQTARETFIQDYCQRIKRDIPHFLRENTTTVANTSIEKKSPLKVPPNPTPARQVRHSSV